ncbi:phospholipase D/Transphosphatidylase [Thermosulfidibacter takaii ABI70S6]|uniref:phospholipase D n=1 Tax=Thermosulfidibacter takaii (strain DSM 17441 / JCM 13301 / NBRC 103674 / ABI70S6) TaxID=1298851 RepID=A0A0S3QUC5_THET7|nr:phospholipase D family protein [Thermosulfidibacter takaii]BAT71926.1 phospholipase D/Transphosphatidylase [Thermosulfidibacter takaii ABI70S6]
MRLLRSVTGFILTATVCLSFSLAWTQEVRVFFSPNGGCTDAVIYEIDKAKQTIDVAMYAFTSRPIAQALVRAFKRGVRVRVVMDKKFAQGSRYAKYEYLKRKGIPVKLVSPPPGPRGRVGLMHHKFAVIDGKVLLTGSFNWTASAEKLNYENLLVFYSQRIAALYEKEFKKFWR